ncbi:hypothetical protein [Bacillus toyonensis]|uniref:hypothetical protein n=1 Tax=Bacillus toyonensis TaxID=155322 RepID=UPI000BEF56E1|nr:hypothetical protein [Bacillus toyonensis]PEO60506.1 hypothetical protein CN579_17045 [Bacillus toyonensis]
MKMKKVAIASITIGTMLTMAACSPSADKEAEKKEQVTAQNEGETKTTSTDEASKTTKDTEKETNTSSNEKTDKDAKNTKESSGTENNGKTTKEKETTGKTNEQTTSGKTDQTTSGKTTDQTTSGKTTKDPKKSVAVKTNVKEVVTLIESLDKQLAANPKLETVNKLGKQINEKWDVIEKELEASHPTDSKTIGQSMYPLIVGAEKEKIDITKMKSLTSKTKKDLNQLLTKLS